MLATHPLACRSREGYAAEQLLQSFASAEIDLILSGEFGLLPVEIKFGARLEPRALRALEEFVTEQACPLGLIINNDDKPRLLGERIVSIPAASL